MKARNAPVGANKEKENNMKQNSLFLRVICLSLSLCMLALALVACKDDEKSPVATGTKAPTGTALPTDEFGKVKDALDLTLDRSFSILGVEEQKRQYYAEKDEIDVVKAAIYDRNSTVEDRLNVEIEWNFKKGSWAERTGFTKIVSDLVAGGSTTTPDAVICYNLMPYVLANNGLVQNLYNTKHIDLTMPWWPSAYTGEAVLNETVYGLVESSAYGTLCQMTGVFFNNDLIEEHKLESPYTMVENNTWTFDNMLATVKDVYVDKDTVSGKSAGDFFGVSTGTSPKLDSWLYGMGYRLSDFNEAGELELLINDSTFREAIDRFADAFEYDAFFEVDTAHGKLFTEERVVFYQTALVLLSSLKDLEINYGIVPAPKGSSGQKEYITHLSNTHEAWCVPIQCKSLDDSSAVIECMASESYRRVDPIYFETCVKLRYAPDERLGGMYDLIRDSITFDLFYLFCGTFSESPLTHYRPCAYEPNSNNWTGKWDSYGQIWTDGFNDIVELYGIQ